MLPPLYIPKRFGETINPTRPVRRPRGRALRIRLLLLITFIESFATICVERGLFFLSKEALGFDGSDNLLLAIAFGVFYVIGSLNSHRLARRYSEKRLLAISLGAQLLVQVALGIWLLRDGQYLGNAPLYLANAALGALNGLKWPLIESYIGAGHDPKRAAKVIGQFNVSWSIAVPIAIIPAGAIISAWAPGLLFLPAGLNAVSLLAIVPLAASPEHLPEDHHRRPDESYLRTCESLMSTSRWLMPATYGTMFTVAAVVPQRLDHLGVELSQATVLAATLDVARLVTFFGLQVFTRWHGRLSVLVAGALSLAVGFYLFFFVDHVAGFLAGEALLGFAAGAIYYAALYYAMVVGNASVDSGGGHEGLIGLGFTLGPVATLAGMAVTAGVLGPLVGIGPLVLICVAGAFRSARTGRSKQSED